MGNTFGKRTLAPGFHQEAARAPGTIPGKTTRVQQELGAGRDGAAVDVPGGDAVLSDAAHDLSGSAHDLSGSAHDLSGPAHQALSA